MATKITDSSEKSEKLTDSGEELRKGCEPGGGEEAVIVLTDSFEDLSYETFDGQLTRRHPSGTISEIARDSSVEEGLTNLDAITDQKSDANSVSETSSEITEKKLINNDDTRSEDTISLSSTDRLDNRPDESSRSSVISVEEEDDEECLNSSEWRNRNMHIFILSEAGKPIYSRYGKEDKLVTIMGVMQALVSFVQSNQDNLRCVIACDHKFVFLVRDHLILVCVSNTTESTPQIIMRLTYVYNQIISILTYSQMNRIFKQRRNFDLRRLLTGTEKFIDNLLSVIDNDPSFLLGAVRCLPLPNTIRDTIAQTVLHYAKVKVSPGAQSMKFPIDYRCRALFPTHPKLHRLRACLPLPPSPRSQDLVFAILLANNQLITLVRMKKYFLHPIDLHLIINLVSASESFKTAESWTPICLPKFDTSGYLHGHVSYLDEQCQTCLLLLSVDKDMFFTLSECKSKIQDRLTRHNCLHAIHESVKRKGYSTTQVGIPDLRHFMYKSRSTAQFTSPDFEAPYLDTCEQERMYSLYRYVHHRIHSGCRPLKLLYHVGEYETLLGWVTSGFELYAIFGPLVTKSTAIHSVTRLLKWIEKEEDRLFILNSPTF